MARKPVSYLASSVLLGTAIGAVVGLLAAPKSGTEIRTNLRKTLREGAERARKNVEEAGRSLPARLRGRKADTGTRVTVENDPEET